MTTNSEQLVTAGAKKTKKARPARPRPKGKGGGRGGLDTTMLKASIVAGSLAATIVGGQALSTAASSALEADVIPVSNPIVIQLADGTDWVISDAPMVELVIPDPVASSRSSG